MELTEPTYPPIPVGCAIEEGRRQLAVGERMMPNKDRFLDPVTKKWRVVPATYRAHPEVRHGVYSRVKEE